jgi:aminocarboxymuconate-semialdehyde decarboxylase
MLYTCTSPCRHSSHQPWRLAGASSDSGSASRARSTAESGSVRSEDAGAVVDIHCHYLNLAVQTRTATLDLAKFDPLAIHSNELTRQTNIAQMRDRASKLSVVEERLADMDRMGVDIQAVSPAPHQYFYFTEPELGAALARQVNEGIAALVRTHPRRFVGLGSVPLQDAERAVKELDHAVGTLGLRGVEINTNVNGKNLTDPSLGLDAFFARANDLGITVFLHPLGFSHAERLSEHYLGNIIGNPLDTSIAMSMLIFDGVLERFPRINFVAAHGGGYLSQYWGRMDHAWRVRADTRQRIAIWSSSTSTPSPTIRNCWGGWSRASAPTVCCWEPTIPTTWATRTRGRSSPVSRA